MKITVITGFLTERYMYINSSHTFLLTINLKDKSIYDFNSILLSAFIILLLIAYYKANYPLFFKRYFNPKHIIYLGNKEDYFYRSDLFSFSNFIPVVIFSLIISFFTINVFEDSDNQIINELYAFSLFQKWIIFSIILFAFMIFRIIWLILLFYFIKRSEKVKKIFLLTFVRITISLSLINILISFILYEFISFEVAYPIFIFLKGLVVFLRPFILFGFLNKIYVDFKRELLIVILIGDLLPSIILFDPIKILSSTDFILAYFDNVNN